jgi:hypothetical protein
LELKEYDPGHGALAVVLGFHAYRPNQNAVSIALRGSLPLLFFLIEFLLWQLLNNLIVANQILFLVYFIIFCKIRGLLPL